ncbi:MAG: exodeoxyribonuclease VII small subunit [Desulfobacteraceae bacterium 4572_35.1]|nr:MAG: exodeoxyribonuclease VII small subunit [Desulfobacteraceae bacterium 4572_35.1]
MAKSISFEEALNNLEDCVQRLEQDNLPIDEAFQLYEAGIKNAQRCQKSLQNIETKVERLSRTSDGKLKTSELDLIN